MTGASTWRARCVLGLGFTAVAVRVAVHARTSAARALFLASLVYLTALVRTARSLDRVCSSPPPFDERRRPAIAFRRIARNLVPKRALVAGSGVHAGESSSSEEHGCPELQGLLFGLATLVLVVARHLLLHEDLAAAPQVRPRRHRPRDWWSRWSSRASSSSLTNLLPRLVRVAVPGRARARAPRYWHDSPRWNGPGPWSRPRSCSSSSSARSASGPRSTTRRPRTPCVVEVTGQQFAWNVRYPGKDGDASGRTDLKLAHARTNFIGLDKPIRRGRRRPPPQPARPAARTARCACSSGRWT